jgi:hypothetical protein
MDCVVGIYGTYTSSGICDLAMPKVRVSLKSDQTFAMIKSIADLSVHLAKDDSSQDSDPWGNAILKIAE